MAHTTIAIFIMLDSVRRLIAHYESPMFREDFKLISQASPLEATVKRWSITDQLNAILAAEGIKPPVEQYRIQQAFAAGEMPMDEMLEHMKLYVASISERVQK